MKFGHCISTLAVFIFAIVLPFVGFSDGVCYLEQSPSGQYVIMCEGDGLWFNYVEKTNEVYVIDNCEVLKSQLVSSVDSISDSIMDSRTNYLHSAIGSLYGVESLVNDLEGDNKAIAVSSLQNVRSDLLRMDSSLDSVDNSLSSLRSRILSIQCGSCPTNGVSGGGSCCDVDLTPILDNLNDAQRLRVSMTNMLSRVSSALTLFVPIVRPGDYYYAMYDDLDTDIDMTLDASPIGEVSILNNLRALVVTLRTSQASINNYLYKITQYQLSSISNHVEHLDKEFTQFSFFVKQRSPLYGNEFPVDGYYSYLTNFYLNVSFDRVSPSETRTNWFSRIETLLAALVFADAPPNQLDEDTSSQNAVSGLDSSFSSLNDAPSAPLSDFGTASRGVVDSIRSFNSLVSDLTMPSTVVLVRYSDSSGSTRGVSDGGFTIEFEGGQIGNLVEASRCVTTLAWTFTGLFFVYWFYHWCLLSCYRLVVFCYSVLSSIFGKS